MLRDTKKRTLLLLALAFRLLIALRSSYLHPDEHLQGPQEIAHGSFGWASQQPWEFWPDHAIRSFVPLWLVYGIPMGFFHSDTNPIYVLYTLRIMFTVLTWVLEDMAIDRLAATKNDKLRCLMFVSTSYVTMTWQAHTFSNSFETILVLWYLVILYEAQSITSAPFQSWFDRHYDSALIGMITVLGVFNRPTFLAFLLMPGMSLLKLWYKFPATLFTFLLSASLVFTSCVYIDTMLYGSSEWVIAPLNFVKYNLNSTNLSDHGLHSRWTHLLVNLPQLLGPGLLLLRPKWTSLPMQTMLSALVVLSVFPHQEARFLIPLVPLACTQMDLRHLKSSRMGKVMWDLWLVFNGIMAIVMGVLHQGGVIPGQVRVRDLERPATVIWWKTYTPPLWVMGLPSSEVEYKALNGLDGHQFPEIEQLVASPNHEKLTVVNLQGAPQSVLEGALEAASTGGQPIYLVAPFARNSVERQITTEDPIWSTWFHLDLDSIDLPDLGTLRLGLGIHNLTGRELKRVPDRDSSELPGNGNEHIEL